MDEDQLYPAGIAIGYGQPHDVCGPSWMIVIIHHLQPKQNTWNESQTAYFLVEKYNNDIWINWFLLSMPSYYFHQLHVLFSINVLVKDRSTQLFRSKICF